MPQFLPRRGDRVEDSMPHFPPNHGDTVVDSVLQFPPCHVDVAADSVPQFPSPWGHNGGLGASVSPGVAAARSPAPPRLFLVASGPRYPQLWRGGQNPVITDTDSPAISSRSKQGTAPGLIGLWAANATLRLGGGTRCWGGAGAGGGSSRNRVFVSPWGPPG